MLSLLLEREISAHSLDMFAVQHLLTHVIDNDSDA